MFALHDDAFPSSSASCALGRVAEYAVADQIRCGTCSWLPLVFGRRSGYQVRRRLGDTYRRTSAPLSCRRVL